LTKSRNVGSPEQRGYYYPAEARALIQVSERTLSYWAAKGKVPSYMSLGGIRGRGHRRYPKEEFDKFVENYWKE